MTPSPRFVRGAYSAAGIYGLLVMLPQYWMERRIGQDAPPAITHPEYFYGFIGVVVAWQLVLLLIARDPARYRALMAVTVLEKLAFGIPAVLLYAQSRLSASVLGFGLIDLVLAAVFAACWSITGERRLGRARAVA